MSIKKEFTEGPGRTTYYWLASAGMLGTAVWYVASQFRSTEDFVVFIMFLGMGMLSGLIPLLVLFKYGASPRSSYLALANAILCLVAGVLMFDTFAGSRLYDFQSRMLTILENDRDYQEEARALALETVAKALKEPRDTSLVTDLAKKFADNATRARQARLQALPPRTWLERRGIPSAFGFQTLVCALSLILHSLVVSRMIRSPQDSAPRDSAAPK